MHKAEVVLSAVEYLNTMPFVEGLVGHDFTRKILIEKDTPAECAEKLLNGKADIGLVPVVTVPQLSNFRPILEWGIGCDGEVSSVLLASNEPIFDLDGIYLDPHSLTSNQLMQILAKEYFDVSPIFEKPEEKDNWTPRENWGRVLIGDKALHLSSQFPFKYDLGVFWKKLTGLPFLFAIWMCSDRVSEELEVELIKTFEKGMGLIEKISEEQQSNYINVNIADYLSEKIQHNLNRLHLNAMELFLQKLSTAQTVF